MRHLRLFDNNDFVAGLKWNGGGGGAIGGGLEA